MRRACGVAAVLALLVLPTGAGPQAGGAERVRLEAERAVLEFENGDLDASEAAAFLKLADRGVADIDSLVAPGLPDWARQQGRIRFVVSSHAQISRTRGRTVVLPLARVRSRSAPYLHETVHALVPARGDRVWLSEGLASYLESWVSENRGGYDAHVFTRAGNRGIDEAARRCLADGPGRAVLPWVGARGEPPSMEEDRSGVARPFYVLSQSLTKHVVDAAGLAAVVRALVSGREDGLLQATGRTDEDWKREWLRAIGPPAPASARRSPGL